MDPPYRSRVSQHTTDMPPVQRIPKRNNVSTDVLRTDEEDREFKRNRTSSYDGAYSRYARVPQDQYQQSTTENDDDLFGLDPYAVYSPLYESSHRPTPAQLGSENAQHTIRARQQDIVTGLGSSILNPQPFQEESDSSEDGGSTENFGQEADIKYEAPPPFVPSSEGTRTSRTGQRYDHNEANNNRFRDAYHMQQNGRQPYIQAPFQAQIQNARSNPRYAYNTLPHQQPPFRSAPSRHQEFLTRLHESMRITSTGRDRRYRLQTEQNNNVTDSLNRESKTPENRAGSIFATKRPRHNTMSVLCLPRHSTSHNLFSITNVQAITRGHWEQSQPLRPILVPNGLLSQQVS
ncbi:hypothetical protein KCU73_g11596, partial [Aureobasidium melanogenum]